MRSDLEEERYDRVLNVSVSNARRWRTRDTHELIIALLRGPSCLHVIGPHEEWATIGHNRFTTPNIEAISC